MFPRAGRLHRRAILIYLVTIVAPACGLLWLGIQSFERQRQALATLTGEKINAELDARTRPAAERAFTDPTHAIATHFFTIEHGIVIRPALHAPPPRPGPLEFSEAEQQELTLNRPDLALASYRTLLARPQWRSLALSRIARCLQKLGREGEARATWRTPASSYADDRDLSHRPYGIVAAINAGDTAGLYEQIASGRWDLAADQAEFFLAALDPRRTSPYLHQFRFARELNDQFRMPGALREQQVYSYTFGRYRILYRAAGPDRLEGFAVNPAWVDDLRTRLERELGATSDAQQGILVYAGAIAMVLLILLAGVALLMRDLSRQAETNQLRSDFRQRGDARAEDADYAHAALWRDAPASCRVSRCRAAGLLSHHRARDEQPKIFDRFYRVANGSGKGGYGLGLFMARHIMEAHGGRAEVESEPGHGSRFRLLFPVACPEHSRRAGPERATRVEG